MTRAKNPAGRGRGRRGTNTSSQETPPENQLPSKPLDDAPETPTKTTIRTSSRRNSMAKTPKEEHGTVKEKEKEEEEEKEEEQKERNDEIAGENVSTAVEPAKATPTKRKGRSSLPRSSTKKSTATPKSEKEAGKQGTEGETEENAHNSEEQGDEKAKHPVPKDAERAAAVESPRNRRKDGKTESESVEVPVSKKSKTKEQVTKCDETSEETDSGGAMELDMKPSDGTLPEREEPSGNEVETTSEQGSAEPAEAGSSAGSAPQNDETQTPNTFADAMSARLAKLAQLRERLSQSSKDNRADVIAEHARSKANPKQEMRTERKKTEAEKLLARKEAEEKGEDYQRKKYWNYSAEDAANWEKAQSKKAKRSDNAFTDYNQVAHKKYKKLVNEIKPNLAAYNEARHAIETMEGSGEAGSKEFSELLYRNANSLSYGGEGSKVSKEAADRLSEWQLEQIEKRNATSRRRPYSEDQDITYISERNARFNKKIARVYDKATKEIRDNFERGTAL